MKRQIIHINGCPTGWNQLTTAQLEWLLTVYARFGSDPVMLQTVALLGLNDLKVLREDAIDDDDEQFYLVREQKPGGLFARRSWRTFPISADTLRYFGDVFMKFLHKPCTLTRFPYPSLRVGWLHFAGPGDRICRMNWMQYSDCARLHADYLTLDARVSKMEEKGTTRKQLRAAMRDRDEQLGYFLSALFTPEGKTYTQSQTTRHYRCMMRLSDTRKQLCLLYWSGCMAYLQKQYRYLFTDSGSGKSDNDPLAQIASIQAILSDRLKMDTSHICNEPAHVILRHLDTMQHEAKIHEQAMNRK
ncbi:MAG: hypothetical protein RR346_03865 [Bacteroidales bacterium]